MKNIIFSLVFLVFSLSANNEFSTIVQKLTEYELRDLPKEPLLPKLEQYPSETAKEFTTRISRENLKQNKLIMNYKRDYSLAIAKAKNKAIKKSLQYVWGKPILSRLRYENKTESFRANITFEGKKHFNEEVTIKVNKKNVNNFYRLYKRLKPQAVFDYNGKSIKLKNIKIPFNDYMFKAEFISMNSSDTETSIDNIDIESFKDISEIVTAGTTLTFKKDGINQFNELSNLYKNSLGVQKNNKKWLFIIAIEDYKFTDNVSYARRSAIMFEKIAQKKLGVKDSNSFVMINNNASREKIKKNMDEMIKQVKDGDTIYFYFSGHGIPATSLENTPFILTADTKIDAVANYKFFSLKKIYEKLNNSKAYKIIVILDSSFSGVTDAKSIFKNVALKKIKSQPVEVNMQKMVVISAAKADQYSSVYDKKGYRLFSFYVMKSILNGDISISKLYKDIKVQTYNASVKEYGNSRIQEPTLNGNFRMLL